jgi:hypothetical protein
VFFLYGNSFIVVAISNSFSTAVQLCVCVDVC